MEVLKNLIFLIGFNLKASYITLSKVEFSMTSNQLEKLKVLNFVLSDFRNSNGCTNSFPKRWRSEIHQSGEKVEYM